VVVVVVDEGVRLEGNFIWENAWMKAKPRWAQGGLEEENFGSCRSFVQWKARQTKERFKKRIKSPSWRRPQP
jgi:hypothetical protein